jgi:hypothetical protein
MRVLGVREERFAVVCDHQQQHRNEIPLLSTALFIEVRVYTCVFHQRSSSAS